MASSLRRPLSSHSSPDRVTRRHTTSLASSSACTLDQPSGSSYARHANPPMSAPAMVPVASPNPPSHRPQTSRNLSIYTSLSPNYEDCKWIRPLPPVPESAPAQHSYHLPQRSSSPRPLPQTPSPSSTTSSTASSIESIPIWTAPIIPPEALPPRRDSLTHRGFRPRGGPTTAGSTAPPPPLVINVNLPPSLAVDVAPDTPLSTISAINVPPSPNTRQKRNVAKLTRHLGDDVPRDLVRNVRMTPLIEVEDTSDSDDPEECTESASITFAHGNWSRSTFHHDPNLLDVYVVAGSIDSKRVSRHWYAERKGKRVEKDYRDVLAGLRKL